MADLAIGISKTAVEALVNKVKSAIKEEAEQWQTAQRDLVFITDEFEMMQSFLNSASGERVKNYVVRTWVRQVRDLSYDVEDCIDFALHLDTKKKSWWLRLLPSWGKAGAMLPIDEVVAEMMQLKARVLDVSQRNTRYNLISDSGSKPMALVQKPAAASTRTFDLIDAPKKQSVVSDLTELITREGSDLQVMSVCGTGGDLGKISIISKAYGDSRIDENFECRAWVKLMHPFNPHEFIRSLVAQFYTNSYQGQEEAIVGVDVLTMMEGKQGAYLIQEFVDKIKKHKYLIVLEDLSTMVQWNAIKTYLPDRRNGSRIVVSTHQLEIANLCTGQPCLVSELRQFSADHSVCVFFKEGSQPDKVRDHSFIREENVLIGRDTEVHELFWWTQECRVITVCGAPGVGKSALVRAVYNRHVASPGKFKKHAWVNVSLPLNSMDFTRSLLQDLQLESTSSGGELEAANPIKECLVVIDDMQSKEDWDWIKANLVQFGNSGNCIIIITSEEWIAKQYAVSSNDKVYNLKGLDADATRQLFQQVFVKENGFYPGDLTEEDVNLILSKCGGFPIVIGTLARYLSTRPEGTLKNEMRGLSANFMQKLETNSQFDFLRDLLAWMCSYLHACPSNLKKCMLYLSIFPQDKIIRRRPLVRRWIAEGYSKGTDGNSIENYVEDIFDELATMSIMQPVLKISKVTKYQVNGFFREYILSRPVEERIFFPLEVSELEKGHGRLTTEGIGQHLAVRSSIELDGNDKIVFRSLDFSRLRSLTLFGFFWPFYLSDRMRVLRVLDLENADKMSVYHEKEGHDGPLEQIGKLVPRLKFLSLRGQKRVEVLPDSLGDLMQLQTLDIRDTSVATLPPWITKLRKLQYIRAGTTAPRAWKDDAGKQSAPSSSSGVEVPRGIGQLEALQTLGAVNINTRDGEHILHCLCCSKQLKKLEVSGINRKHDPWLSRLMNMESLSLQFEENTLDRWYKAYSVIGTKKSLFGNPSDDNGPKNPRSIKLYGHVGKLPQKIGSIFDPNKLSLEMTEVFTPDNIEVLGCFQNLRTLRLLVNKVQNDDLQFPAVNKVQDGDLQALFSELHNLEIVCKSKLHVRFDEGAMKKLELLEVYCCKGSAMQFSGLQHPVFLKQVWLQGEFDDALKETFQQQLAEHPNKPALELKQMHVPVSKAKELWKGQSMF